MNPPLITLLHSPSYQHTPSAFPSSTLPIHTHLSRAYPSCCSCLGGLTLLTLQQSSPSPKPQAPPWAPSTAVFPPSSLHTLVTDKSHPFPEYQSPRAGPTLATTPLHSAHYQIGKLYTQRLMNQTVTPLSVGSHGNPSHALGSAPTHLQSCRRTGR